MWSSAGMFLSCVVIVLALLGYFDKMVALGAVATYVSFFEIGLGPIPVSLSNSLVSLQFGGELTLIHSLQSVAHCGRDVRWEVCYCGNEC